MYAQEICGLNFNVCLYMFHANGLSILLNYSLYDFITYTLQNIILISSILSVFILSSM
jgi:hypothetical protein